MNSPDYIRRHSRWYEQVLLSYFFQFIFGILILIGCSAIPIWGFEFWKLKDPNIFTSLANCILAFFISTLSLRNLFRLPGSQSVGYVLPVTTVCFAFPIVFILFFRTTYSIQVYLVSYLLTLIWCYMGFFVGKRYRIVRYALLPFGEAKELDSAHGVLFEILKKPDIADQRYNAILADFNNKKLTPEWEKFLAKCTLFRIPVYSVKRIRESLLGRIQVDHLSENEYGSLLPSSYYEQIKRAIDLVTAIGILPILIPFFILISILIRMESKGCVFFIQERMGFRGRTFKMFKFRSMYIDQKGSGFTKENKDPRITKIGKFIRKFRIDELPQIFNIFLGQMSFIGPRPESYELSQWYEKDVPFFAYRHVVRPGISGWAQVEQGYAAEVDGMKIKLEYDFYYIKNFSFWLDLLITFKTIKTILTGFGAR
jgi:lipopolysaccharide/colanic/teichoic acid biosynthesis glycosyltransferase